MLLSCIDTEMHRWSSFYRKRSTTSLYVCMYVCMYVCNNDKHTRTQPQRNNVLK